MLNGRLALWDVDDVEAFCAAVVPRSWRNQLTSDDREQLLTWLIETAWELSVVYTPGGISFSTFAGNTLRRRIHDWLRNRDGRTVWKFKDHTYERAPVVVTDLTDLSVDEYAAAAFDASDVDPAEHRDPDGERLGGVGTISAVAYFPPGSLRTSKRVRRPSRYKADRERDNVEAEAA